uniref:Uncharacterized protein n=1 Tax=Arundo donax TaxID=35708 RepID=A0A0A9C2C2_ARUDO
MERAYPFGHAEKGYMLFNFSGVQSANFCLKAITKLLWLTACCVENLIKYIIPLTI